MLASANHPIDRRLEVSDLTANARWPIQVWEHRMPIGNQARGRVEFERAVVPEDQRQVSRGQRVARADLPQVRVVDEETDQAQEERRYQGLQVKGDRSSG